MTGASVVSALLGAGRSILLPARERFEMGAMPKVDMCVNPFPDGPRLIAQQWLPILAMRYRFPEETQGLAPGEEFNEWDEEMARWIGRNAR